MSILRISLVLMIFLILMSELYVVVAFGEVSANEATSALTDAEGTVVSAYRAVLDAEQAGVNVSGLLGQLNEAGENLALAHIAYTQGDFEKAASLAILSKNIGKEVQSTAASMKDYASSENTRRLWLTMISSIVGMVGVSLVSFWVWRFLKRHW
jgi:hypothetical protein